MIIRDSVTVSAKVDLLKSNLNWARWIGTRLDRYQAYLLVFEIQRSVREPDMLRWQLHGCDKAMRGLSLRS